MTLDNYCGCEFRAWRRMIPSINIMRLIQKKNIRTVYVFIYINVVKLKVIASRANNRTNTTKRLKIVL